MNIELLEYCLKGLRKRWKEVLRTSVVIFIAFTFVAGTLIFQSNISMPTIQILNIIALSTTALNKTIIST